MVGPETQNALSPNLVLVLGTMKSVVSQSAKHNISLEGDRVAGVSLHSIEWSVVKVRGPGGSALLLRFEPPPCC